MPRRRGRSGRTAAQQGISSPAPDRATESIRPQAAPWMPFQGSESRPGGSTRESSAAKRREDDTRVGPRPASRKSSRRLHTEYNTRDRTGSERCKTEGRPISAESSFFQKLWADNPPQRLLARVSRAEASRTRRERGIFRSSHATRPRSSYDINGWGNPLVDRRGRTMLVDIRIRDLTGMCHRRGTGRALVLPPRRLRLEVFFPTLLTHLKTPP